MILFCHLLVGAAIATKIQIPFLALILAFLSHYLLDALPHYEYSIKNIQTKQWKKTKLEFLKIALDFCAGIALIFAISEKQLIIFAGAILAVLPDASTFFYLITSNKILKLHDVFHKAVHFNKNSEFTKTKSFLFLGILTQISITILAIATFLFWS